MNFSFWNEIILAIILGFVQGFSEFLPISSTAHIALISKLLTSNRDIGLQTSNFLQFGTLIAILQYFWVDIKIFTKRILEILRNPQTEPQKLWQNLLNYLDSKEIKSDNPEVDLLLIQLGLATLPIIIFGSTLRGFVDGDVRDLQNIALFLVAGSILMVFAEQMHKKAKLIATKKQISWGEVLIIGVFQAMAIFPGVSRSGATTSGALLIGKDRKYSVRFSFLLSIPALLLSNLAELVGILTSNQRFNLLPTATSWGFQEIQLSLVSVFFGVLASYLFGLIFLRWLLAYLSKNTFYPFVIYRLLLAGFIFFYLGFLL